MDAIIRAFDHTVSGAWKPKMGPKLRTAQPPSTKNELAPDLTFTQQANSGILCKRCREIHLGRLFAGEMEAVVNRITWAWKPYEIKRDATFCYQCDFLLKVILKTVDEFELSNYRLLGVLHSFKYWNNYSTPTCRFFLNNNDGRLELKHNLRVESGWRLPPKINDVYKARRQQPIIDPKLLSCWLNQCLESHTKCCRSAWIQNHHLDTFRVIDVQRRCVIKAPAKCQFLALSYVWGGVKQPLLLRANIEALSTEWALDLVKPRLPGTIRDAVQLCSQLNERYLWVDSLCLVQDETDHNSD